MQILKTRLFAKWATKEGLTDKALLLAVEEMERGLIDADLGGHVVKKRVALAGRGKRGGARTLMVYKTGNSAFFVQGFAKSVKANIEDNELKALKAYAALLTGYSEIEVQAAVAVGALIEVDGNE